MASPIYARTLDGIRDEVTATYYRVSDATTRAIVAEYAAAHVRRTPAGKYPPGSVLLDRYGGMRPSRAIPTPCVITARPANAGLIAAIKAMRPADVAHMQCDDNGCGIAIVAHVLGESYAAMRARLCPHGVVRMMGTARIAAAMRATCRECRTWAEVMRTDVCAALIRAPGARVGHYVAIGGGVIIDPELVEPHTPAEYPRRAWLPLRVFTRA